MPIAQNLRRLRKEAKLSQEALAKKAGVSQQLISQIERGENSTTKEIADLSRALGVAVDAIDENFKNVVEATGSVIGVKGLIGAGGVIETSSEQIADGDSLYQIEVPFSVPEDAIAFEVRGVSMWPRYDDGDVIVCHRQTVDPDPLIGWEAAVGTPEGDRYLKRLLKGSKKGHYRLESHNAPPMDDVKLAWFSDIALVVRANQVRRLSKHSRRKIELALKA